MTSDGGSVKVGRKYPVLGMITGQKTVKEITGGAAPAVERNPDVAYKPLKTKPAPPAAKPKP